MDRGPAYQAKYTPLSRKGLHVFTSLTMAVGSMLAYKQPTLMVAGVLFFGLGTLVLGLPLVTRRVALTVDETGIAFGDNAPAAWSEIVTVEVTRGRWRKAVSATLGRLVEIGPDQVDGEDYPEPGTYADVTGIGYCKTDGWRLSEPRFSAAVEHFAPRLMEPPAWRTPA